MSNPSGSYRNPRVVDEDDDDDLDDLDDVLASFNAPPKSSTGKRTLPGLPKAPGPSGSSVRKPIVEPDSPSAGPTSGEGDEDFEASLVEGMEALLRQLAGDHPPGPMPDVKVPQSEEKKEEGTKMSADEEEAAWQRAIEMMLSGEGLAALGLDKEGKSISEMGRDQTESKPAEKTAEKPDFDEAIRRTMEQLKKPKSTGSSAPNDLEALLAQLGDKGDGDEDLGGLLDGMMAQLMTKEVLEEPMSELASKYPGYLANPPSTVSAADLEKYRQQHMLVSQIVSTFKKTDYTDEKDGKEIARLVGEMQDLGGPPAEIMGDLPDGFDLNALGNDEGCTIM